MNRLSLILIATLVFICTGNAYASACEKYVGTCEYYQCQEQELNCGKKGYLLNYGHRFCTKFFHELDEHLSLEGKEWMKSVGNCLQQKIESFNVEPNENSCSEIKKLAYRSHSDCYLSAGFCHLPLVDKMKIFVFLKGEFFKYRTQKEGIQVLFQCIR